MNARRPTFLRLIVGGAAVPEATSPTIFAQIVQAVEARFCDRKASYAYAKSDAERDSIAIDIEACGSLLRKLAASEEAQS